MNVQAKSKSSIAINYSSLMRRDKPAILKYRIKGLKTIINNLIFHLTSVICFD